MVALLKNNRSSASCSADELTSMSCLASVLEVSASGTVAVDASGLAASPSVSN